MYCSFAPCRDIYAKQGQWGEYWAILQYLCAEGLWRFIDTFGVNSTVTIGL
jgi:hypothetical protein